MADRRSHDLEEEEGEEESRITPRQPGAEGPADDHVGGATDLPLNCESSPPRCVTSSDLLMMPVEPVLAVSAPIMPFVSHVMNQPIRTSRDKAAAMTH